MKKFSMAILSICFLAIGIAISEAAQTPSDSVKVKVKITSSLSISIEDATKLVDLQEIAAGSTKVSRGIVIKNNGSGIKETYSLSLANPPLKWKASETNPPATGVETYILNAAFATTTDKITWDDTKHGLSKNPVPCSDTKFAGDQIGKDVPYNETRTLWFQFKAPTVTEVIDYQEIPVTITAG